MCVRNLANDNAIAFTMSVLLFSDIWQHIIRTFFFFAFYEINFSVRFAIYTRMTCMEQTLSCTQQ